jgi:hypothetical protein
LTIRRLAQILIFAFSFALPAPAFANLPTAPGSVTVTSTSVAGTLLNEARARVSWTAVNDAIGYVVRYRAGTDSTTVVYVNTPTGNQAQIQGLTGGRSYNFTVSSYNATGERAAESITFTPVSVPAAPTVESIEEGVRQVTLKWNAAATSETGGSALTGYYIESDQGQKETVSATTTERTITGLTNGSTHTFTIKAINSLGFSSGTAFEQVTVFNVPGTPSGVTLTGDGRTLTSTWSAPTSDGGSPVTGYSVALIRTTDNVQVDSATTNSTTRTATFNNVANGTYQAKVLATNLVGDGSQSTASSDLAVSVSTQLADNTPVFAPSNVRTIQVDGTLSFVVSAPSGETPTVTVAASPANACTLQGSVITAVFGGTCDVRATVRSSGNFASGDTTITLTISKLSQSITFPTIADQSGTGTVALNATASSGFAPVYSASGDCTLSGSTLTTQVGTCTVVADQGGNAKYAAALSVSRTFRITVASSGGSFFGGGGGGAVVPRLDTSTANEPVAVLMQPSGALVGEEISSEEFCFSIRNRIASDVQSNADRCGRGSTTFEFTLKEGEYQVAIVDREKKRSNVNYSMSISKGEVAIPSSTYLIESKRFLLRVGALLPVETKSALIVETKTVVLPVETKTSSSLETSTSVSKPSTSDSKTVEPSTTSSGTASTQSKPKITTVTKVSSTLPVVKNPIFQTQPSAKKVSRVGLIEGKSELQTSKSQPLQLRIPISSRSAVITIKVKLEGKPAVTLINERKVKKGNFDSQLIQFKKIGNYSITVTVGKKKSTLALKVRK